MRKLAVGLLILVALGSLQSAVRYLFATEFMPYHAVIVGKGWAQVEPNTQFMLLTLIRAMGAGMLAVSAAILLFAYRASRGERWAGRAALCVGACIWIPSLYLTIAARVYNAQAQTPSATTAGALLLLAVAAAMLWFAKDKPRREEAGTTLDAAAG